MSCPNYRDALQELADGTLGPIRRAELQVHLETCARCRALAEDLVRIRDLAASLDRPAPPDAVWFQLAGRLRQEGRIADAETPRTSRRRMAALAIAAGLVIAIGASIVTLLPRNGSGTSGTPTAQQGNAGADDPVLSFGNEMQLAEQHYQKGIALLEEAAKSNEDVLDPQTAALLKKNLQIVDQGIAESLAALRVEPQSAAARNSLFHAMKRKVSVLQDTVTLMNEIRKGNPAATGRLVDGLNKS